jgi:MFS family permease
VVAPTDVEAPAARFDRRFPVVVAAALAYFIGLGTLAPVLPQYVEDELGGGGFAVGVVVGAFAVSAALFRPWVGRLGDTRGRRLLVVGGSAAFGASVLCYGLAGGFAVLVLLRLVSGIGEAATFVGAATTAQDMAPADRRGQAASLFSIAVYGGLAIGPVLGEWVYDAHGADGAWVAAAAAAFVGTAIGLFIPARVGPVRAPAPDAPRRWLHPAGVGPGIILLLGATGYAGFASFVPLYVDEIGVGSAGPAFVEYGVIVLTVRIFGSRLPDVLGTRRGPLLALALQGSGLLLMGLWASAAGLYVSTAVYAVGVSLLYPALFPLVVDGAPDSERSQAVATFTLGFDLSQGLGAPLLGAVVALSSEQGAFIAAGILSFVALVLHRDARLVTTRSEEPCPPPSPGE